jgi:hypothetical protein
MPAAAQRLPATSTDRGNNAACRNFSSGLVQLLDLSLRDRIAQFVICITGAGLMSI